jgi:hypothetical protein
MGVWCDISIYTYIVPWFGSSSPLFSLFPDSPSGNDLDRFQCSIFTLVEKVPRPFPPSSSTLPSCYYLPLLMTSFAFLSFTVSVSVRRSGGFRLDILPGHLVQSHPVTLPHPFPPTPCCSTVFSAFCRALVLHRCHVFQCFPLYLMHSFCRGGPRGPHPICLQEGFLAKPAAVGAAGLP